MEENQKTNNSVNTDTSVNNQNTEITPKKKPFKKKNFNGHLRSNHNHKKEKFIRPNDEDENEIITSAPKPIYNDLFYFLRQKFSYNKDAFFELLNNVLKVMDIKDIKEGNMTLFSYSAMYEKNEIFMELVQKYPNELNKQDFENYIIPVCLSKNEETLEIVIDAFNKNITLDSEFIKSLMSKMAKTSYREGNNTLILNWLNDSLTPELNKEFWDCTFNEKNIALTNIALNNIKLKSYLKDNFEQFIDKIERIGKKAEITRKLNLTNFTEKTPEVSSKIINIQEEPKIYLGDKEEQIQNLIKEDVQTKVTIKRRKIST